MIKFKDGEPADLLPPFLKEQPEIAAISYACKMAMQILLEISVNSRMYSDIDNMPEYILDYMAVELNANYYDAEESLEIKRNVVKNSIYWKMKAGTKEAVQELIAIIFGSGELTTWDEFDGEPGTFDVDVPTTLTQGFVDQFAKVIEKNKNATSHLLSLTSAGDMETDLKAVSGVAQYGEATFTNDMNIDGTKKQMYASVYMAAYSSSEYIGEAIYSQDDDKELESETACYAATGFVQASEMVLA